MMDSNLDETIPTNPKNGLVFDPSDSDTSVGDETSPNSVSEPLQESQVEEPSEEKPGGFPRLRVLVLTGFVVIFVIAALSAWSGYAAGINLRTEAQATQDALIISEQYSLALSEIEDGQFFRARQRLEYIIDHDPNYPGVTDTLAEVLLLLNATATPSPVPTPTQTPVPDTTRSDEIEELFSQAEQQMANNDWSGAIDTLLLIRKQDPAFRMVAIDGMLFLALRNRGIDKINVQGELEEGVYNLALAEKFGPLDSEAQGSLTWAKLYITGASFWELDWAQAVYYFSQVAPQLPSLRDGSGWTARERYRIALFNFGNSLVDAGDPCQALEQYELSLSLAYDEEVELAMAEAAEQCYGGQEDEESGDDEQLAPPTAEPTGELPPGPTLEPTPYP